MGEAVMHIVCWLYSSDRRDYTAETVNEAYRGFRRHLSPTSTEHRFICITDRPEGLLSRIEALPMPEAVADWPNNFRKLWIFSDEAADLIGGRIFVTDIDVRVVGSLDRLLDRPEDAVFWTDPATPHTRYSGGNYLLDAGSRAFLWDEFDISRSPALLEGAVGSDQAWMSHRLGDEAVFGPGIYRAQRIDAVPGDAAIIHFSGKVKPWHPGAKKKYGWL